MSETKKCVQCSAEFTVEPDDFAFYKKIDVPAPKMCSMCRAQRRLAFRNERSFYKRPCDKCKKDVISIYSPNKPYTVWCHDCWFSDNWDARDFARPYDAGKPFFEQFKNLWQAVPKVALMYTRSVNSEYTNISADSRNCYMLVESSNNENCIHGYWLQVCKDLVDVSFSHQTQMSYECDDCYNSYQLFYSKGCHDTHDGYFLLDCRGCSNCIGCVNLRNKKYHIFNKPVSKDEYGKFLKDARLDTYSGVEALRKKFDEFKKTKPLKYAEILNAPGSTGNYIKNAKNCKNVFHCYDAEDSKYGVHVWRNAKDCFDCDTAGRDASLIYNSMNCGVGVADYIGVSVCWTCTAMRYSYYCFNSNHCFGSVGLRKQDYCILNKQYEKPEYGKLTAKIAEDMKQQSEWGEFFPADVSTFGYNESAAQEQFPLTKDKALARGFKWEDHPRGTFGKETVSWPDVPDSINDYHGDIAKEIFACTECEKNYRVIQPEFEFYKKLQIPLPRLCPDCRHVRRFTARGPNRLWKRQCACDYKVYSNSVHHLHHPEGRCPNEFDTSYASDRKEIVYCEQCYNAEVA